MDNPLDLLADTVDQTAFPEAHAGNYPILGLVSEIGELASELKKVQRNDGGLLTPTRMRNIAEEFGDILWYLELFAQTYGLDWTECVRRNRIKLLDRKAQGTINER